MRDKLCWLLYDDRDLAVNRDFAALMRDRGARHGLAVEAVCLSELRLGMDGDGAPTCLRGGAPARPQAVLSRQRDFGVSLHFERMGLPVFNPALACLYCNDKRLTHRLLAGLPMADTLFAPPDAPDAGYPLILKPACGHGGDRVTLVSGPDEWRAAAARIRPEPMLQQRVVTDAGRDLRVYVLFGQIVAGVMRTAQSGVVSNFKLGGQVAFHMPDAEERALALAVARRFEDAGAPLALAGIDLLYDRGRPVVGEAEDVVGSRMLYQTSDYDIADEYLARVAMALAKSE